LFCSQNRAENANEDVVYSTPNSNWPVIDSYTSGEVMEVHVAMEYYHAVSAAEETLEENISEKIQDKLVNSMYCLVENATDCRPRQVI